MNILDELEVEQTATAIRRAPAFSGKSDSVAWKSIDRWETAMNVEFVDSFLVSTVNVMKTMANTEAKPGKPFLKNDRIAKGDVTGIIGMNGMHARGSLSITFPEPVILHIYAHMLGESVPNIDDSVVDCVGEITNMICGGAKAILSKKGYKFELAIPSMIAGKEHTVHHKTGGEIICIPLDTGAGSFFVEGCFEKIN